MCSFTLEEAGIDRKLAAIDAREQVRAKNAAKMNEDRAKGGRPKKNSRQEPVASLKPKGSPSRDELAGKSGTTEKEFATGTCREFKTEG
jgi:hypothetical protein